MNKRVYLAAIAVIAAIALTFIATPKSNHEVAYVFSKISGMQVADSTSDDATNQDFEGTDFEGIESLNTEDCDHIEITEPDESGKKYLICFKKPKAAVQECECPHGMSTTPPTQDVKSLLEEIVCRDAKIEVPTASTPGCPVCYGDPVVKPSADLLKCSTSCGEVECGSSKQIPCPNKPNCVLTCKCEWGGWEQLGPLTFRPKAG